MTSRFTRSGLCRWVFVAAILTPSLCAQAPQRLHVEVGPNQRVRMLVSNVSYGEVLRAMGKTFDWEMQIPALADEVKVSYFLIKFTEPRIALAKLLEGTKLGYSFMAASNGSHSKVFIIPSIPKEEMPSGTSTSDSSATGEVIAHTTLQVEDRSLALMENASTAGASVSKGEQPSSILTRPLSEAVSAMGVPQGVAQADVGKANVFVMADAARTIGLAQAVSPWDLGRTIILPLSDATEVMAVPTMSSVDIGKSVTAPVPTGSAQYP